MAARRLTQRTFTLVLTLALLAAFVPAPAGGAPAARQRVRLTAAKLKTMSPSQLRSLFADEEEPAAYITGQITHTDGDWEDAALFVVAYQQDPDTGEWFEVGGSDVAADGTYSIGVATPPDGFKLGVIDFGNVYDEAYFFDRGVSAQTLAEGTEFIVVPNSTLSDMNFPVTALPANVIRGTVHFSGAPTPTADIENGDVVWATAWAYYSDPDPDLAGYYPASDVRVHPDGTYTLHLPEAGTYRVGFDDESGVFTSVFFKDAASAETAIDVSCPDPAHAPSGIDQTMTVAPSRRIAGQSRYDTAVEASKYGFKEGAFAVVLATGENWPDAISGSALAAQLGAPLLLTRTASLPQVTRDEILRLQPQEIIIVGGYPAVSLDVEIALRTEFDVPMLSRIAGRDRYETSTLVAESLISDGPGPFSASVQPSVVETGFEGIVVATGEKFPDAMSAAPLAAAAMAPVVLVRQASVPPAVSSFLARHPGRFTSALVVGSAAAISTATANAFPSPTRISGADRYGTSAAVAQFGVDHFGMRGSAVGIASGVSFPDGLAAVPVLAWSGQPLLLTRPDLLSAPAEQFMVRNGTVRALVFGGEPAVSADTYDRILQVLQ